jgi:hypothetical protein
MLNNTSSASHPIVIHPQQGVDIARLNADGTWSVQWDAVRDQPDAPPTSENAALRGACEVLLAARDNFFASPWDHPSTWDQEPFVMSLFNPLYRVNQLERTARRAGYERHRVLQSAARRA